jgi:hypothetical protein
MTLQVKSNQTQGKETQRKHFDRWENSYTYRDAPQGLHVKNYYSIIHLWKISMCNKNEIS